MKPFAPIIVQSLKAHPCPNRQKLLNEAILVWQYEVGKTRRFCEPRGEGVALAYVRVRPDGEVIAD